MADALKVLGELRLGGEPDAVPRARQLARRSLAGRPADVAHDAELVVSELMTNAVLHGAPPFDVRIRGDGTVRVEVEDRGRNLPIMVTASADWMTGRGLALVRTLSSRWGVEAVDGAGKMVWAELSPAGGAGARGAANTPDPASVDVEALLAAWDDEEEEQPRFRVQLPGVSTELLLAAKSHVDNVVRELTLLRDGEAARDTPLAPELEALVEAATVDFADARAALKRQAAAAAARGDQVVDLALDLPLEAADAGERYLAAMVEADRYARAARLLTVPPQPAHRIFRQWYLTSLITQLRARARGEEPPEPRPLHMVLADALDAGSAAATGESGTKRSSPPQPPPMS